MNNRNEGIFPLIHPYSRGRSGGSGTARALLLVALLGGCAVGPDYERPAVDLPASWQTFATPGAQVPRDRWWGLYSDPVLDRLVEESLANNQDMALAAARVDEARAFLR